MIPQHDERDAIAGAGCIILLASLVLWAIAVWIVAVAAKWVLPW